MIHQLKDTNARIVVCTMDILEKCLQLRKELDRESDLMIVVVGLEGVKEQRDKKIFDFNKLLEEADKLKDEDGPDRSFEGWSMEDRSCIVWSSGTTGRPKGIQHNYKYISFSKYSLNLLFRNHDSFSI